MVIGGLGAVATSVRAAGDGFPGNFQIQSSDFVAGETATVEVRAGAPESVHLLFFDLQDGDYWLNPRQWFGLGFSPSFRTLSAVRLDEAGSARVQLRVPASSGLEGETFHLQGVCFERGRFQLSNRIDQELQVGEDDGADWLLTRGSFKDLDSGEQGYNDFPITQVYGADKAAQSGKRREELKQPGDVLELKPGSYRHFRIAQSYDRKPGVRTVEGWDDVDWGRDPQTVIRARVPDSVAVEPNPVGGSQSLMLEWAGAITFEGLDFVGDDQSAIGSENPFSKNVGFHMGFRDLEFVDCTIEGGFDFLAGAGPKNKWGVLNYAMGPSTRGTAGWIWRGGHIQGIYKEHCNYFHNVLGDLLFEDTVFRHCGRTAFQMANRVNEGPAGVGDITFRRVLIEDVCLQSGGGGSALSFNGRHSGTILLDRVKVRLGADPRLAYPWNENITGALVVHAGGDTDDLPNGDVVVRDCDFQVGPHFVGKGSARRPNIAVRECQSFSLMSSRVAQLGEGAREAIDIQSDKVVGKIVLDDDCEVIGRCMFDGVRYDSYAKMLSAVRSHPKVEIR